jgi:DNA-binding LacI/PurR family transcriptional regulator
LADVARLAAVSPSTVSRVFNNKMVMRIPPLTIDRIRQAASDLSYSPNRLARALATRRTQALGFYTREMTDPHGALLLDCIEAAARELGYHVLVSSHLASIAGSAQVDGIVALSEEDLLSHTTLPQVTIALRSELPRNTIGWSDYEGGRQAARHLAELGHRRIAALYIVPAPGKQEGFRAAAQDLGLSICEFVDGRGAEFLHTQEAYRTFFQKAGFDAAMALLEKHRDITAIFTRNDVLAMGVLQALYSRGIAVPRQMSLISYSDTILAQCAAPAITSVHTPIVEAGKLAVVKLIELIEGGAATFESVILPTTLVKRDSTACASPAL